MWDPRGRARDTEDARTSDTSKRKTPPTGRASAGKRKRPGAGEKLESKAKPQPAGDDSDEEERQRIGRETVSGRKNCSERTDIEERIVQRAECGNLLTFNIK